MATFVLIHGGGHGGWCDVPVAARSHAAGHDVRAPGLPGCGGHAALVTPAIDLEAMSPPSRPTRSSGRARHGARPRHGGVLRHRRPRTRRLDRGTAEAAPWSCFAQPLRLANGDAAFRLPRTNVDCTPSFANSPPDARARRLDGDRNDAIDTGQDLMLTEPDRLGRRREADAGAIVRRARSR